MLYNQNNLNVAKIASKHDTRPELAGVYFTDSKTVATDMYRLLEITTPAGVEAKDYPSEHGRSAMRGCKPFIVNAEYIRKNVKLKKNNSLPILNCIAISHIDKHIEVLIPADGIDGLTEPKMLPRIDGKFPDYEQIFPKSAPIAEVELNGDYLAEILTIMAKLDNTAKVKIKFFGGSNPVVVEAGSDNQKGRAMVMPLRQ